MKWICKIFGRFLLLVISLGFIGAVAGIILFAAVIYKYGQSLPDYTQLKDYSPPVVTRVHWRRAASGVQSRGSGGARSSNSPRGSAHSAWP